MHVNDIEIVERHSHDRGRISVSRLAALQDLDGSISPTLGGAWRTPRARLLPVLDDPAENPK